MLALGNRWVLRVGHSMELGWSLFLSQVILQMWKEKLREANGVAQGHTASKQHSQSWYNCVEWKVSNVFTRMKSSFPSYQKSSFFLANKSEANESQVSDLVSPL